MSVKTKTELKSDFSDNTVATGAKFADLIDSLKAVQTAVSDPEASGTSVTFIATISQNENGEITVTKKTVNMNGYQTIAGMESYQKLDLQQVGSVDVSPGDPQTIEHNMDHYPTVRLLDENGDELLPTLYRVRHTAVNSLDLTLEDGATGTYNYVLD